MATQKAVVVKQLGQPVELSSRLIPEPGTGEVLIKVAATMLLPHDTFGRDMGILIAEKLPAVLGSNVAGEVVKTGPGVSGISAGELVFGFSALYGNNSDQAGLQQYALLNADAIGQVPRGFSAEQAVTLPVNLVTSFIVLFSQKGFNIPSPFSNATGAAETSIVIVGGGTNVGQLAIQLARIAGVGRVIVIAGLTGQAALKAMGATHVIDRHQSPDSIAERVQDITGSDEATFVYDCANMQFDTAIATLSKYRPSKLRTLMPIEPEEEAKISAQRPESDVVFMHDIGNEGLGEEAAQFWLEVPKWLGEGKILLPKFQVIEGLDNVKAIDQALDGYRDLARVGPQTVVKI